MTPEEAKALKIREIEAKEEHNRIELEKLKVEERKSNLNFWAAIAAAIISVLGGIFGIVYVNDQKNKDVQSLHKRFDELKSNNCSKELAQQRLFYDSGELGQVKDYARRIWAELHMQGIISESDENVVD